MGRRARVASMKTTFTAEQLRAMLAEIESKDGGMEMSKVFAAFKRSRKRPVCCERVMDQHETRWVRFTSWCKVLCIAEVTSDMAERYIEHLENSTLATATIRKTLSFLSLVWRVVVPSLANPWDGIKIHKRTKEVVREAFTVDELRAILSKSTGDDELDGVLWLLAYTGLRLGDVLTLTSDSIHLDRGVIELVPRKTGTRGTNPMKSLVGIHPAIRSRLEGKSGLLFPRLAERYERDGWWTADCIRRHIERCGISTRTESDTGRMLPLYGAHSFRHTVQTLLTAAMVHPAICDAILAHKSPGMAQRYTHISDEQVIEAMVKAMPEI